jgi:hypothetical protein
MKIHIIYVPEMAASNDADHPAFVKAFLSLTKARNFIIKETEEWYNGDKNLYPIDINDLIKFVNKEFGFDFNWIEYREIEIEIED